MKTLFVLLLTLVVSINLLVAQVITGDSWATTKASGSGILGVVYYEQPGLIEKTPDGQMKGVCVDIVSDFAAFVKTRHGKNLTIEYLYEETEFPRFLSTFQKSHNMLGVTNTSITEKRKKIMAFTPPFMNNEIVLLTSKNAPSLENLSEIAIVYKDFTAQVITGSTHVQYIEQIKKDYLPALKVEFVPSSDLIIKNLATNPKIFSVIDFTEYIGVVRRKIPIKRQNVSLGKPEPLGFIMSKESDWEPLWREFLTTEYVKSVRYKEIIAQNLGSSFLTLVR
jgi:ABC-type amino acid transport substrate-binding protein